jgi:O-antigen/teichoic acid export membrane protein
MLQTPAQTLSDHRIARATATLFGSNVVALALQTLQFVLLARLLGVEEFAHVAAANALITIVVPLAGLGYGNVLLMRVATDRTCVRADLGNAQLAIVLLGVCLVVSVSLMARLIYGPTTDLLLVVLMASSELVLVRLLVTLGQAYQAIDRVDVTSGLNIGIAACRVAAIVSLTVAEIHDAARWAMVACGLLAALTCCAFIASARILGPPCIAWQRLWAHRSAAAHFALGTGAKSLYTDLDKVFLGHFAGAAELGAYTAAYRLTVMSFLPIRSLLDASATHFYRRGAGGIEHSYGFTKRLLKIALPYGALAALLLVAAAQWTPRILGASFQSATTVLYALAPLPLIQAIHYTFSDALTSAGLQQVRSRLQWLTVCVYAVLASILIPVFGWKGAAAVCVVSESLLAVLVVTTVRTRTRAR